MNFVIKMRVKIMLGARDLIKQGCYLCGDCADENGGKWPKGHVATFHAGKCNICGKEASLCCATDYDFDFVNNPDREI